MEGKLHWVPLTLKVFTHKFFRWLYSYCSAFVLMTGMSCQENELSASTKLGISGSKCFTMTALETYLI